MTEYQIHWIVPPACQGQIVEVAYAAPGDGYGYRRTTDRSDRSVTHEKVDFDSLDMTEEEFATAWDPANAEPTIDDSDWSACDDPGS